MWFVGFCDVIYWFWGCFVSDVICLFSCVVCLVSDVVYWCLGCLLSDVVC